MFDRYISLGENCEPAFQFRRALGKRDTPSFFARKSTPPDAVLSLIRGKFEGIYQGQNMTWLPDRGGFHDASHGFFYHPPADREEAYQLAEEFLNPTGRVCYFYKVTEPMHVSERVVGQDWGFELRECITPLHARDDFQIVVIMPPHWPRPRDCERLAWRTVSFLAPLDKAYAGDNAGWDAIFAEFPHEHLLALKREQHTMQIAMGAFG